MKWKLSFMLGRIHIKGIKVKDEQGIGFLVYHKYMNDKEDIMAKYTQNIFWKLEKANPLEYNKRYLRNNIPKYLLGGGLNGY